MVTTLLKPCLIFIRVLYYYSTIFSFQMYVVQNKYCFKVSIFVNMNFAWIESISKKKTGIEKKLLKKCRKNVISHSALDVLHHQAVTLPLATVIKRLLLSTSISTGLN